MSDERLSSVDVLRSLAILLVLVAHYAPIDPFWGSNGVEGVYVFFVCSGFLLAQTSAQRENLFALHVKAFYWRRLTRLAPLLCLTIALASIVNAVLPLNKALTTTLYVDNPLWLLPFIPLSGLWRLWALPFFGIKGLFWGLLWTLGCEFQGYAAFPWLLRWAGTQAKAIAVLVLIVMVGMITSAGALLLPIAGEWTHTNAFSAYGLTSLGVLLYFAMLKPVSRLTAFGATAIGSFALMSAIAYIDYDSTWQRVTVPYLVGTASALLLYGLLSLRTVFPNSLCLPGKLCYGLYLWHPFALYLGWQRVNIIGYLCLSLAIAVASHQWLEKPAQTWLRQISVSN